MRIAEKNGDTALIHRALAGDEGAFESLYRSHSGRVFAVVNRCAGDGDDRDDLVQTTFVKAFQALPGFRGQSAFSTWLTRITINVCTSHLRARQVRENLHNGVGGFGLDLCPPWSPVIRDDPETEMVRKERRALVRRGIRTLPLPLRRAVWLRYVQEKSYREITEALQVPMGTVKIWLYRGRHCLKGEFQKLGVSGM